MQKMTVFTHAVRISIFGPFFLSVLDILANVFLPEIHNTVQSLP